VTHYYGIVAEYPFRVTPNAPRSILKVMRSIDKTRDRVAELERELSIIESERDALRAVLRMTLTEVMQLRAITQFVARVKSKPKAVHDET
jgi:hypothetical protein